MPSGASGTLVRMPVEIPARSVHGALADLSAHDPDDARDAEAALEWMAGWEGDGAPLVLRRYDLQVFLWYALPRRWLVPAEDHQRIALAMARLLDGLGDAARGYAALCRGLETRRLLRAWGADDPAAPQLLEAALETSGLEPPDTGLLRWGSFMGPQEAGVRGEVTALLEEAVETGRLASGARGFAAARAREVEAFLRAPSSGLEGRTPIDAVGDERLGRWADRGSVERRGILAPAVAHLRAPSPPVTASGVGLEPVAWLLDAAADGQAVTQTGALNRALVQSAVERFPTWWRSDLFGPPNREAEVVPLHEIHDLLRRARLLRRTKRRVVLTRRGASLRADPTALLAACAPDLIARAGFPAACQELVAALLLSASAEGLGWDQLDERVHAAIVADGWHAGDESPRIIDVRYAAVGLVRLLLALDLARAEGKHPSRRLRLAEAGSEALRVALRDRAVAPQGLA